MRPDIEKRKVFIVVRTYPTPANQGIEVSCTAAITEDGKWFRLFPVPYRFLESDKKFKKYQWISVPVVRPTRDRRPESHKLVNRDAIEILSDVPPDHGWRERKAIVLPLVSHCLCCLKRQQDEKGRAAQTLGIFKPKTIERLVITPESPQWSQAQLDKLRQNSLFEKKLETELEKVPFKFQYRFRCDDGSCRGHQVMCTDWEMGQSWRKWRDKYGDGWETKFRERYEDEMIRKNDTYFYVGTMGSRPKTWIIVGLFYPPKAAAAPLFNQIH